MPAFFPPFAGDLAIVYALTGRTAEALDLAERAVRQAQSMQRLGRLSLIATHLGEVRLLAGQPAAAEADGRRALALAEAHQERGNMVYALRLLGLAAAEKQPPDLERARGHHAEALALAGELGMRPLAARCHLGLGRLAHRAGDDAGARAVPGDGEDVLARATAPRLEHGAGRRRGRRRQLLIRSRAPTAPGSGGPRPRRAWSGRDRRSRPGRARTCRLPR